LNAHSVRDLVLEPADNQRLANLCGQFDEHLKQIEQRLGVQIRPRGNRFEIEGPEQAVAAADRLLVTLFEQSATESISPQRVHAWLQEAGLYEEPAGEAPGEVRTRRGVIRGRGANQASYLQAMRENDLSFGIGPAGTGKTYLAVASAVEALERDAVRRIVLVRPAVEAGERLGFLPGDLSQKVDPYLRPMYDALYEMLGFERVAKLIERHVIEIAPLAFMARAHAERGLRDPRRGAELDRRADEDVPHPHRLRLARRGYRRRDADRPAGQQAVGPQARLRGSEARRGRELHLLHGEGRGAPPARATHRRGLRAPRGGEER
jgi:phosphate starvation-inducible protein PhoH